MGEKSSVAGEGSSIFESLFGGFSNGLSIFANNPFRRKNEAASSADQDASAENDYDEFPLKASGEGEGDEEEDEATTASVKASLEVTVNLFEEDKEKSAEDGDVQTEEHSASSMKKKANKRAEEDVVSEKKRRKTDSAGDIADGENAKSGSSDSRKRKQDLAVGTDAEKEAGLDDITGVELKKKTKKKSTLAALEAEQQTVRQSPRNAKKRQNEEVLPVQGSGQKERKLEKTSAGNEELEVADKGLKATGKRPAEVEGGQKQKKKMKRLEDIESEGGLPNKVTEEVVGRPSLGVETRSGSKRKKDSEVEELYERKRRVTVEGKESSRVQGSNGEQGGVADMELADRLRGKRKLGSGDDEEDEVKGAKKKKLTKEDRVENEDRLKRTIFVGNLPVSVKTKQLVREFSQFGVVESARLRSVPLVDSKLPRKAAVITGQLNESRSSLNGYVVFQKAESAKAALAHNMTEFNGKHLRVDMATAPRKADNGGESGIEYDHSRSIFVGNLPFDVEDEEVHALFKGQNPDLAVEAVRVVRDPKTSIGKGFAFVCFKKKLGATTALDNAQYLRLRNRQLRIVRFGFQKKQVNANPQARTNTGNYRSKPRAGAEERISRRSVLSYEGTRASKVDGRPGKGTGPAQTSHKGKSGERGGPSKSVKAGKKEAVTKRPAVAARKLASQGQAGSVGARSGKRKREEKGKKVDSKLKRKKLFKK